MDTSTNAFYRRCHEQQVTQRYDAHLERVVLTIPDGVTVEFKNITEYLPLELYNQVADMVAGYVTGHSVKITGPTTVRCRMVPTYEYITQEES